MRKYLIVALLLLTGVIYAAGEYVVWQDNKQISVTTDDGGDSTYASGYVGVGSSYGFNTLHAQIILNPASPTYAGLGNQDSGWVWLYTSLQTGQRILIDSAVKNALPCTLTTVLHSAVGDTLLRDNLEIGWAVFDSLGDSAFTATYPLKYKIYLK